VLNRFTDFLDVSIFNYTEIGMLLTFVCILSYLHNTTIFIGFCIVIVYILLRFREVFSNHFPKIFQNPFFGKIKN